VLLRQLAAVVNVFVIYIGHVNIFAAWDGPVFAAVGVPQKVFQGVG
jgi:hypothetical protein